MNYTSVNSNEYCMLVWLFCYRTKCIYGNKLEWMKTKCKRTITSCGLWFGTFYREMIPATIRRTVKEVLYYVYVMVGVCVIQTSNVRTVFKIVLQDEVTKG